MIQLKSKYIALSFLLSGICISAQNPVIQTQFTPDPAPMIYKNRLYVFTGDDQPGFDFYTMTKWRIHSSDDMVNWTDHGSPISLESFSWARDRAWAAQCIERNGKFYWYICAQTVDNNMAIGVAVSDSPTGPYKDALGKPLISTGSWDNIDPTVFIDDDDGISGLLEQHPEPVAVDFQIQQGLGSHDGIADGPLQFVWFKCPFHEVV